MSKTKFTKGPWRVQKDFNTVYALSHGDIGISKAIAKDCGQCDNQEEVIANAYLIATAPEMYEELESYCRLLSALVEDGLNGYTSRLQKAKRVLDKARGESE